MKNSEIQKNAQIDELARIGGFTSAILAESALQRYEATLAIDGDVLILRTDGEGLLLAVTNEPAADSKGQTYCHPECPICAEARDKEDETIVVTNVQTPHEKFTSDSPLVALLIAVNLAQPVTITTEKMTRRRYQSIPATTRSHALSQA